MTKDQLKTDFTEEDFRDWLSTKKPNAIIGKPCTPGSCPIAKWIRARSGDTIYVLRDSLFGVIEGKWQTVSTPYWMFKFISRLDGKMGDYQNISVKQALNVLQSEGYE